MRKCVFLFLIISCLTIPVQGLDAQIPQPPGDALDRMPVEQSTFAQDLWFVIREAAKAVAPQISRGVGICASIFAMGMLLSTLKTMSGRTETAAELAGVLAVSVVLLKDTAGMVDLAADTIYQLSDYGKLLIPVMATALVSQGGIGTSTALYTATAIWDAVLCAAISTFLVPLVYVFLAISIAGTAVGEKMLTTLGDFVKWIVSWLLKTALYVFTGYISITGVISGTADAAALKATKLTMSGMIPVVGGILSDASEAVVVGASLTKNAVGVYGMVALISIWIAPFLRIGVYYLLLKLTGALSAVFDAPQITDTVKTFATAMGLLLAMTGAVCVLLLISMVCFMKGMA